MAKVKRTGQHWLAGAGCTVLLGALVGCSAASPSPSPSGTTAISTGTTSASTSASSTPTDAFTPGPSDVNLPAPPIPTSPAASTAGDLTADSLPAPPGWKPVVAAGGPDEGYIGNGTSARARDPQYAAYEILAIGCAPVKRSGWTDPTEALEVEFGKGRQQGFGEALRFAAAADAATWFTLWQQQLSACTDVPRVTIVSQTPTRSVGRRDYGNDERYAEVAVRTGSLIRLYILEDPQDQLNNTSAEGFAEQLAGS